MSTSKMIDDPAGVTRPAVGMILGGSVALALAALALFAEFGPLDHAVAEAFYDAQHARFPARSGLLATIHNVQTWAVVAFGLLLMPWPSRRAPRRASIYLLACIAVTTLGVGALKQVSPVECPWSLTEFGGAQMFKHTFATQLSDAHAGHCAPGAHSSGAFALLGVFVLLRQRRHRAALPVLLGVSGLGLSFALCQWVRGAHFPSHDLWTACIAWCAACALQPLLHARRRRAPRAVVLSAGSGSQPVLPASLATLLLAALVLAPARAQAGTGTISAIEFRGNEVTREEVMQREIGIRVGDLADDARIEHSRQSIQDLGLFRKVEALQEPDGDNTRVVFQVKEKWYLLVYPRLSANTDGQNALGGELRWNNLFGRNHRLRAVASSADNRDEGRGREMKLRASYSAPFAFGTPYTLDLAGASSTTPVETTGTGYDESITELELLATRHYGLDEAASQGWNLGTGIKWRNEDTQGEFAPEPWGDTYAWVLRTGYRNVRDHIYSETGTRFEASYEIADQHAGSDYSYSNLKAEIQRSMALGSVPHQTLELSLATGSFNNGPFGRSDYSLGGTNGLRGYDRDRFEGDFYYLFTAAYLRPVYRDWLRFVATFEAGNVFAEADAMNTEVHTSIELGFRVRVPRLVNFEFELGYAFPIDDDSGRIYGSRNGF